VPEQLLALRAMVALGMSQRVIAEALGISQPAVSQQLKFAPDLVQVHPQLLFDAAVPVLKARAESDIDLLVEPPPGTSPFDFVEFKMLLEHDEACG